MKQALRRLRNMSLRIKISALFFVFIFCTVFIVSVLVYSRSAQVINRKLVEYNNDILMGISSNIDMKLDDINQMTTTVFTNATIQNHVLAINASDITDFEKVRLINEVEKELINATVAYDSVLGISIITASGAEMKTSTLLPSFALGERERKLVNAQKGAMVWLNEVNGVWGIAGARVFYDLKTQKPQGYLIVRLRGDSLKKELVSNSYFSDGLILMVDNNYRQMIGNSGEPQLDRGWMRDYTDGDYGVMPMRDGRYIAFHKIRHADWRIISVLQSSTYEVELIQLRKWTMTVAPPCALAIFLFSYWIASSMLKPLKELSETMKSVGEGNFSIAWKQQAYDNEIGVIQTCFEKMVGQIIVLMDKSKEQQKLFYLSELNSLRMQINPHFIYNALDSIGWMASSLGNDEIVEVIYALGRFMRSTISGSEMIPLKTEIENVQNYLIIQNYRYGDKLSFSINIPDDLMDAVVPRLILQPLVENAIVHGIEGKLGKGHILLRSVRLEDDMGLIVEDDGVGMTDEVLRRALNDEKKDRDSIGMYNVHRRLQLHYGAGYGLTLKSEMGKGTRITARMPIRRP